MRIRGEEGSSQEGREGEASRALTAGMFRGEAVWGRGELYVHRMILARGVCVHMCALCVSLRVDACVRACTWARLSHVLRTGLAQVCVSYVKGISILYNPNTLQNLVVASLVWVEVAFLL